MLEGLEIFLHFKKYIQCYLDFLTKNIFRNHFLLNVAWIRMTSSNKLEDPDSSFISLETRMTHPGKFGDWSCILL
jgi:hypothetical protein